MWTVTRPLSTAAAFSTSANGAMMYGTRTLAQDDLDYTLYVDDTQAIGLATDADSAYGSYGRAGSSDGVYFFATFSAGINASLESTRELKHLAESSLNELRQQLRPQLAADSPSSAALQVSGQRRADRHTEPQDADIMGPDARRFCVADPPHYRDNA